MFKESKYPIKQIAFWFLILAFFIGIFKLFYINRFDLGVPLFNYSINPIKITIELDKKNSENPYLICFDERCLELDEDDKSNYYHIVFNHTHPVYKEKLHKNTENIYLVYPKNKENFVKNINNIYLNIGPKDFYISKNDIKNLPKKELSLELNKDKEVKNYNALLLSSCGNLKSVMSQNVIFLLSLFYNWKVYLMPYLWLIAAGLIYLCNREKFQFDIKISKNIRYITFSLIILFAIILRITNITTYPLWLDEVYTNVIATSSFASCFKDAGNPPLFYILEYLFKNLAGDSLLTLRFLPFVFGVAFVPLIYLLFRKIGKNEALFASFFASVNIISIAYSQEARGYSLAILLSVALVLTLITYLRKSNFKNLILYSVVTMLAINTNYYLMIFAFTNFVWVIVDLIQNNKKDKIGSFVILQIICALTIVPYFVVSFKNAISANFNAWIPEISQFNFVNIMNQYFLNKYMFIVFCLILILNLLICFLPEKYIPKKYFSIDKKKEDILIYLVYSIIAILIIACLISVFVKPIVHKRVLVSLYGLLFILQNMMIFTVIKFEKINKYLSSLKFLYFIVVMFFFFSMTTIMPLKKTHNIAHFMNFIVKDSQNYKNADIHAYNFESSDYIKNYPEIFNSGNITWHFIDGNANKILTKLNKEDFKKTNKKTVVYLNSIGVDMPRIARQNEKFYFYQSNLTSFAKVIY